MPKERCTLGPPYAQSERTADNLLTDLFKDPFLSSAIPMVTPTRCHRATGGNPFMGDCGLI